MAPRIVDLFEFINVNNRTDSGVPVRLAWAISRLKIVVGNGG